MNEDGAESDSDSPSADIAGVTDNLDSISDYYIGQDEVGKGEPFRELSAVA